MQPVRYGGRFAFCGRAGSKRSEPVAGQAAECQHVLSDEEVELSVEGTTEDVQEKCLDDVRGRISL